MRRLLFASGCLLWAATVSAQVVPVPIPPTTRIAWTHDGVNTDRYELVVDGGTPVDVGQPTPLEVPFPPKTPGVHQIVVRACNAAACTASEPLSVTLIAVPTAPTAVRLVQE